MKFKMAVEMEFDIPTSAQKAIEGRIDEFCEEIARATVDVVDETARTATGISVKYIDNCWVGEDQTDYANGILYFGNGD